MDLPKFSISKVGKTASLEQAEYRKEGQGKGMAVTWLCVSNKIACSGNGLFFTLMIKEKIQAHNGLLFGGQSKKWSIIINLFNRFMFKHIIYILCQIRKVGFARPL
ncbi:MAG: hypothetical protein K8H85_10335 [Cyclobacteriaceae bacterium]|nr:hypothetical protein [Cyclobacteriaceae bacterium]MBS1554374.1 hypothetical protein [Bacteroidota bacterium]MBZ0246335.1 hypothetical protein [Cyclobacteriaceae bacterium]